MKSWVYVLLLLASALFAAPLVHAAEPGASRSALSQIIPQVKFQQVPLSDAIEFMRDVSGANLHVNWRALEDAGVPAGMPVSLEIRRVTVARALDLLLSESSAGEPLTWYMEDGVVEITTRAVAGQRLVTRVYPIDDLLMEIPDFATLDGLTSDTDDGSSSRSAGRGNSRASSGSGVGVDSAASLFMGATRQERGEALVQLIVDVIQPEIWQQNGGPASIRYFDGKLIVTAPRSVQAMIGG